jgi:hypothetical protein
MINKIKEEYPKANIDFNQLSSYLKESESIH